MSKDGCIHSKGQLCGQGRVSSNITMEGSHTTEKAQNKGQSRLAVTAQTETVFGGRRAFSALPEVQSSVPTWQLMTVYNPSPRGFDALFWVPGMHMVHRGT